MARIRKIRKNPPKSEKNYFLVDACFLVEKYLPLGSAPTTELRDRLRQVKKWWKEIDRQVNTERGRVYVPDLCIAEAFKVFAKKYYQESEFSNSAAYKSARDKLAADVSIPHKDLKAQKRHIKYHDVPATRDIIIAVDRFYELFLRHGKSVQIVDLVLVATAKYLMDFHDAKKSQIHIITLDKPLWEGVKKVTELPNAFDPAEHPDSFESVFKS